MEAGLAARREVLGDEYVDRAMKNATDFNKRFQEVVSEYCWGLCWTDETLSRRERSILNLGMIAALGRMEEFELHFRGALRNGLTEAELRAVLMQIAGGTAAFLQESSVSGSRRGSLSPRTRHQSNKAANRISAERTDSGHRSRWRSTRSWSACIP